MLSLQLRLVWHLEWPYWESAVFDPKRGHVIPTFHRAIKKTSAYGVNDGFAAETKACLERMDRKLDQ
jgi:hypothetical protein